MTLTAIVGALVALVAKPKPDEPWDRLEKLVKRVEQLSRSQAKLIDRIESLERELAMQTAVAVHWRAEAQRIARQAREERERQDDRDLQRQYAALAQSQQARANERLNNALAGFAQDFGINQANQTIAQLAYNGVPPGTQAQQNLYAQYSDPRQQEAFGFCNCVPSRSQVWGSTHGLVQELNRGEG